MSLLYGITKSGEKIHIDDYKKGIEVFSSLSAQLVAKKGTINSHHYAHKYSGNRDIWLDPLMTEWHRSYQEMCAKEYVEYRIEKNGKLHIADVYNKGCVIELQHSPISQETVDQRERFYGNMIWLFDYTCNSDTIKGTVILDAKKMVKVKLNRTLCKTTKPTYLDIGSHILRYICASDKKAVWCMVINKSEFIQHYFGNIAINEYQYSDSQYSLNNNGKRYDFGMHIDNPYGDFNIRLTDQKTPTFAKNMNIFFSNEPRDQLQITITDGKKCRTINAYFKEKYLISNALLIKYNNYIVVRKRSIDTRKKYYIYCDTVYQIVGIDNFNKYVWLSLNDGEMSEIDDLELEIDDLEIDDLELEDDELMCNFDLKYNKIGKFFYVDSRNTYTTKDYLRTHMQWVDGKWRSNQIISYNEYIKRIEIEELERKQREINQRAKEREEEEIHEAKRQREELEQAQIREARRQREEQEQIRIQAMKRQNEEQTNIYLQQIAPIKHDILKETEKTKQWWSDEIEKLWQNNKDQWKHDMIIQETKRNEENIATRKRLTGTAVTASEWNEILVEFINRRIDESESKKSEWKRFELKRIGINIDPQTLDQLDSKKKHISELNDSIRDIERKINQL